MTLTVLEAFSAIAISRGNSICLSAVGKTDTSFNDLICHIQSIRAQLAEFGICRGKRVGVVAESRDLMAAAHLAVICTATSAPINPHVGPAELEFAVSDFKLDALIIEAHLEQLASHAETLNVTLIKLLPAENRTGIFSLWTDSDVQPVRPGIPRPEDISVLLYTSGTTSRPKIVPRTQEWQVSVLDQDNGERQVGAGDKIIDMLPLNHTEGLNFQFLVPLLLGAHVILSEFDAGLFVTLCQKYRPSKFTLVPVMHQRVIDWLLKNEITLRNNDLRYIESSSAKLPKKLRMQMEKMFGVPVIEAYGATEAGALAVMELRQTDLPEGSVGKRAHSGVVIMDNQGQLLPAGKVGEICVKGAAVINGFENNPEADRELFREGWYLTGDEGYLDQNEYLFVTGRIRESISRGGEQISPVEIDAVLEMHPGVARAATFGIKEPTLGQEVWAAVVPIYGIDLDPVEIRAFASRQLSFPKTPKKIIVVDKLPYTELGEASAKFAVRFLRRIGLRVQQVGGEPNQPGLIDS